MGILSCDIDAELTRDTKIDENNNPVYPMRWIVQVDSDDYFGFHVLSLAQRWTGPGTPAPRKNDPFNYFGFEDGSTYADTMVCKMIAPNSPRTWVIDVEFKRSDSNSKEDKQKKREPNPLKWDPIYYVEWDEEQIPLELARCMSPLRTIKRGAEPLSTLNPANGFVLECSNLEVDEKGNSSYDRFEFTDSNNHTHKYYWPKKGPLVNAAGQQTIDPIMVTVRRPILVCKRNYPFTINSLIFAKLYTDTFNIFKFLGGDPGTWKFLSCVAAEPEEKEIEDYGTITYVPTVTKLAYKHETWDIKVLNNGQSCFRYGYVAGKGMELIKDPRSNSDPKKQTPLLMPTLSHVLKSSYVVSTVAAPKAAPTAADFEEVESTEPMNLRPDGTQIGSMKSDGKEALPGDPTEKANHIAYRNLTPYDYNALEPFLELVKEYKAYLRATGQTE